VTTTHSQYIPALGIHWLTPYYDRLVRWMFAETEMKRRLVAQIAPVPGMRVLDLGCGTGTLLLMLQQAAPGLVLTGLDIDPTVLRIAQAKSQTGTHPVSWVRGPADSLPFAGERFDRVVTSLVTHHLTAAQKRRAFREVWRVLKPGGEFHIFDFGPPHDPLPRAFAPIARPFEEVAAHLDGEIVPMLAEAGFVQAAELDHAVAMRVAPLSFFRGVKPGPS
jgi:ubiquinone/menaquinone biosynthesis C-methylase UbiE